MKRFGILLIAITGFFLVSCATTSNYASVAHFTELDASSMPSNRYVVLGEISVENTVIAAAEDFAKEAENEISVEPKIISIKLHGDDGKYGFIGKPTKTKLSIYERAEAVAEYKLIELAKYNEADAIICFNSSTEAFKDGANVMLTTKASGVAVKIKADEGYSIKFPVDEVWDSSAYSYTEDELEAEAAENDEVEDVE